MKRYMRSRRTVAFGLLSITVLVPAFEVTEAQDTGRKELIPPLYSRQLEPT